ncbi:MAG: ADP-ribosyl-[dinitrogen reductase] hydrolase [Alphaproteobacteria bacterium CG_4_10_14_0_2_um_filter_63_37]|nr:MAG: ADP-ribosyl-[dinitrogen reductase] hydrolase [Proteobacteria bacterium CG1_02_64_396]PJA23421.1 MAG: ADP-ribosyl-[dinitrogen reductase] hydrolase [Alphaproteobacteria bacterium CG_4_10_14_0_2_um_filter_63_37]
MRPGIRNTTEDRAVAAYLGLAIGDALGATVEFMTPREIAAKHGTHDQIQGGGWLKLPKGRVTDDTTMALALGGAILDKGRVEAQAVGEAFDAWMRGKPVDIGNTVRRGILHFRRTAEVKAPGGAMLGGNGACMRTLPVALATFGSSDERMVDASRAQGHLTHPDAESDAGTECVNRMIQQLIAGVEKNGLIHGPVKDLVEQYPTFRFRGRTEQNPDGYIVHTLRAVFQAFFDTDTFEECLVDVVNRGGDADTTGAIAGMLAGACYGCDAIPPRWLKDLHDDTRQACIDQALALIRLPRPLALPTSATAPGQPPSVSVRGS